MVYNSEYHREYYKKNRDKRRRQIKESTDNRTLVLKKRHWDFLTQSKCADCGNDDPRVLEFDHLPGFEKRYTIGDMLSRGYSWETVQSEMDKCEVVCAIAIESEGRIDPVDGDLASEA